MIGPKKLSKTEFFLVHLFPVLSLISFGIYAFTENDICFFIAVILFYFGLFVAFYYLIKPNNILQKKYRVVHISIIGSITAWGSYIIWQEKYILIFALFGLYGFLCEIFKHSIRSKR